MSGVQQALVEVEAVAAGTSVAGPGSGVDKTFRPYDQSQALLLPPSLDEWLPQGHLARFVDELVEHGLDLAGFYNAHTQARGAPPYDPRLMLKLALYAMATGVTSSRAVERRCSDDVAFRWLTANNAPDYRSVARFRARHEAAIEELFVQSVRLCDRAGMVGLGDVAVDGTKVRANASRHKAMSYDRMVKREEQLQAEVAAIRQRTRQILDEAAANDAAEDAKYGRDRRGDELPDELARASSASPRSARHAHSWKTRPPRLLPPTPKTRCALGRPSAPRPASRSTANRSTSMRTGQRPRRPLPRSPSPRRSATSPIPSRGS